MTTPIDIVAARTLCDKVSLAYSKTGSVWTGDALDIRDALLTALDEIERLRADVIASDERMAAVLDGTFSVGDGTTQREIERLRAALTEALDRVCDLIKFARNQRVAGAIYSRAILLLDPNDTDKWRAINDAVRAR